METKNVNILNLTCIVNWNICWSLLTPCLSVIVITIIVVSFHHLIRSVVFASYFIGVLTNVYLKPIGLKNLRMLHAMNNANSLPNICFASVSFREALIPQVLSAPLIHSHQNYILGSGQPKFWIRISCVYNTQSKDRFQR